MDAVQKVGNGTRDGDEHGPTAYLLFQKWLKHDPSDPNWVARPLVLSWATRPNPLHPALPLRLRPRAGRPRGAAHLGSQTPGHPEVHHTKGVETTTGPLGQGVGTRSAWRWPPRERGLFDPDAPEGESLFDHTIWAFASDGDLEEGVSGEASSLAGTQQLGNLVLVYDNNRISIEDDTNIAFTEDVRERYEAYGWHVQRVDGRRGPRRGGRRLAAAKAETGRPRSSCPDDHRLARAEQAEHRRRHGSALGDDEVAATKKILGFDPEKTFDVAAEVIEHAREIVARGQKAPRPAGAVRPLEADDPRRRRAAGAHVHPHPPEGWAAKLPTLGRRPQGRRHPQGLR